MFIHSLSLITIKRLSLFFLALLLLVLSTGNGWAAETQVSRSQRAAKNSLFGELPKGRFLTGIDQLVAWMNPAPNDNIDFEVRPGLNFQVKMRITF